MILDLFYFHRNPHAISIKEALITTAGWIGLAMLFNLWIYYSYGATPAIEFLTGYLLEESLSIDNLFIFLVLFAHFKVPPAAKHRVLFYGILGAIVMRALLIWGGLELVQHFRGAFYLFGGFLIFAGIQLSIRKEVETPYEETLMYRFAHYIFPSTTTYHGTAFFIKQAGKWLATPLFTVLVLIEMTDLFFALDSVPAILGITTDPFIVYTSNIFAILGLRSFFFALEGLMTRLSLLNYALSFLLIFIGVKMLISDYYHIPVSVTLGVIVLTISTAIIGSLWIARKEKKKINFNKKVE